ncbi:MAG: ApeA N-terminal domain 1-containing protein [Limisphaerales bacterium]
MRLPAPETLSGFFWVTASPSEKLPGVLSISAGGGVELELVGNFDKNIAEAINSREVKLSRIHGLVESRGAVTLDDCFYINRRISLGGISKSKICVNLLISGAWFGEHEEVAFDSISFSVDGLDQWVNTSGFKVSASLEDKNVTVSYHAPKEERYSINDEMTLSLGYTLSIPGPPFLTEARVTQSAFLTLKTKEKQPFRTLVSAAYKIVNFLSFCIDKTVTISEITARSDDVVQRLPDSETFPAEMKVVYKSLPFDEKVPDIKWHSMLLRLPEIRARFSSFISAWFRVYETVEPSIELYFSSRTGAHRFINGRFLAMSQCLETFHRRTTKEVMMDPARYDVLVEALLDSCPKQNQEWLRGRLSHGNEVSLRRRLRKIMGPFENELGGKAATEDVIDLIVNTRNYFTHYSPVLEAKAAVREDLWSLCMKMEAVFQLHLMKQLGLADSEVSQILRENWNLHCKLK